MNFESDLAHAGDELLKTVVAFADVPALLPAIATALGDHTFLPPHIKPQATGLMDPTFGLTKEQLEEAKQLALSGLTRLRDLAASGKTTPQIPRRHELAEMLQWAAGDAEIHEYVDLLQEELGLGGDFRKPKWNLADLAPERSFKVVIIGAGMSGIAAALRAAQAGLDVVVLEKNADLGGTWYENTYPGCRVDVSNLFYSYSFAQRDDWPEHYSSQAVLHDYFAGVAKENDLVKLIQFNTEVTSMTFNEESGLWDVQVTRGDGSNDSVQANAIISAVGQLNRPSFPDIPNRESFHGPAFHSAKWDHSVDLTGKNVAVIGTGASAAQFIPAVAKQAANLTVFQRTPGWMLPSPQYTDPVSPEVAWLRQNIPGYTNWSRFWTFWRNVEGMMAIARVDPNWDDGGRSVSAQSDLMRQSLTAYLQAGVADRPDLASKIIPEYPPFAKRFIMDNGVWAETLKRDNVSLVTTPIDQITKDGVETDDGKLHEVDVIIYGTGFAASDFLTPMQVTGRNGIKIRDEWAGDARAYLGITLPGIPNFFMLYGPNTNIVVNGSIIYFSECAITYIMDSIRALLESDAKAIDLRLDVHDAYNEEVDAENAKMAWGVSSVNSWYKNATGRTAQNWPFTLLDYWQRTHKADLESYELL